MSTRPARLAPELAEAVEQARLGLDSSGELPRAGSYRSALSPADRAVVARIIADGTYRRLAQAVAETDPDIADQ